MPHCYFIRDMGNEDEGVLILEDMSDGVGKPTRIGTLSVEQLIKVTILFLHPSPTGTHQWRGVVLGVSCRFDLA